MYAKLYAERAALTLELEALEERKKDIIRRQRDIGLLTALGDTRPGGWVCDPVQVARAAKVMDIHGEVYDESGRGGEGWSPDTRRLLVEDAMEDIATDGYTERKCKAYAQWTDQVCDGITYHGTITFVVNVRVNCRRYSHGVPLTGEEREDCIAVLRGILGRGITVKQYNLLQKEEVAAK